MADDLNRLLIKIQADTSQLATALQAAESGVARSSQRIERSLEKNSSVFRKWGDDIAGQFKRLVAGYAGLELISKGIEALNNVAELKGASEAADLTTTQFQELAFAAGQANVSTEELSRGLSKFAVNMAQVRLNTGPFNKFLQDQAPALRDALAATTSQDQAIRVLSNALSGLGDRGQQATVVQQAFGRSSLALVEVLAKGSGALDDAATKAHELGVVLDNELIESADKTQKEFAALEATVTAAFERMAVGAANFASATASAFRHPITALGELLDKMNSTPGAYGGRGGAHSAASMAPQEGTSLDLFAPKMTGWDATVKKSPSWSLRQKPDNTGRDALAALQKQFDTSNGNINQALQDQYDQELKQWQDMLDKKQISEQQFAEARTQLGIVMLNEQKANLGAETQLQKDYYTQTTQLIDSTFMDSFSNALQTGKFKASDFFNSLLQGFAKVTTEVLVLKPLLNSLFAGSGSGGGLSSILNGLIGIPARAAGGPGNSNQPYLVGEHGPEIFTPSSNGSFGGSGVYARGNSSGGNVYNIDARGADVGVADRLTKLFASQKQQSPVVAVRQASRRFPNRN